jgi:hypothetical protein
VPTGSTCVFDSGLAFNTPAACNIPVAVPASLTPGVYHVGALVDDLRQVAESDDNNNRNVSSNSTTVVATAFGPPATLTIVAGDGQTAAPGTAVPIRPSVVVRDAAGVPVPLVDVIFRPVSLGAGYIVETDLAGIATIGWTLGEGVNVLTATASGLPPVTSYARGDASPADFDIALRFTTTPGATLLWPLNAAVTRWESIITGDLADVVGFDVPEGTCTAGAPAISGDVDDVVIEVVVEPIDGLGGVLATAAPCVVRGTGSLPVLGTMRFDEADFYSFGSFGGYGPEPLVQHAIGHVLGIGTLWTGFDLLANPSLPDSPDVDTHYTGVNGIAGFDAIGGTTYTGGAKVPVENSRDGLGTRDGHWRESVLANELMTGVFNDRIANPLSELTVRSLMDLGYTVDVTSVDSFALPAAPPGGDLKLLDDIGDGPIYQVDSNGQITELQRSAVAPIPRRP